MDVIYLTDIAVIVNAGSTALIASTGVDTRIYTPLAMS